MWVALVYFEQVSARFVMPYVPKAILRLSSESGKTPYLSSVTVTSPFRFTTRTKPPMMGMRASISSMPSR